ncbi:TRAP-type C4-dicarboxylate transport system, small permease component (fragment) [anaerobic digester metagenome]|uniref:TRAP-type C4-dicarboxylate transport system, small permease component n=1 Tax=anaerobic digester metagenome TaxID=1263854 RepID=A0A485LY70_9ZZZZ
MNLCAFVFWVLAAWHIGSYANSMVVNGVVSPTAQVPFYYFIYLIALGLLALCLVLLVRTIESIKKAVLHR